MDFTGERFIPTEQGKIRLEHYHRYAATLNIVVGKEVLDLACGEGYGSFLMADIAESVVGIDISPETVKHASQNYKKQNLDFYQGSATELNFPDSSFDVIVSFETIEHLAEQEQMITEMRRVLRPHGVLIISSPNRPVYSEESGEHNEFHVKELDFNEFDNLLKTQFPFVQYYGQRMLMGSVIQSFAGGQDIYRAWHDDGTNLIPKSGHLQDPVYFIAIAAANELLLPGIEASIIYPTDLDLIKHYVGFAKWAQDLDLIVNGKDKHIITLNQDIQALEQKLGSLNQTVSERDQQIHNRDLQINERNLQINERNLQINERNLQVNERNLQIFNLNSSLIESENQKIGLKKLISEQEQKLAEDNKKITQLNHSIAERDLQIIELDNETVRRGEWALGLEAELNESRERLREAHEAINALVKSGSWKFTLPLREARRWVSKPGHQSKRYLKESLGIAKRLYQGSIKAETKEKHRQILAKHIPKLLSGTDTRLKGDEKTFIFSENKTFEVPDYSQKRIFFDNSVDHLNNAKAIEIPVSQNPLVSVIIPIYGNIEYTLTCLASIAAECPQMPFELIIVDDCSPDNSIEVLKNVKGLKLIQNETNQGFIRSCNIGAAAANGVMLYFLNNDTQVTPGWMDELVRTFHEFPGTGLAGSKLIYPDGRLQEAGGIIWQDGSAWNFGRLQDPKLPIYNYAREVDYCSGASIMIPKTLFEELGGFDELYLPAYCEDSDLALRIREKGYRVIYQPLSTIIHYEGVTSGTDLNSGVKAYQKANSEKLFSRWKNYLSDHQIPGIDVDKAKDRRAKYRILVLEHCTPTPNQDAGSVTVFNLLLLLREMDFQVTFIPEDNFLYMPDYTSDLQRIGIEVLYGPYVTSVEEHLKEFGDRYDLAFLFRPTVVERNIKNIRHYCPKAKVMYYTHDLHFLRMQREAELFQDEVKSKLADKMKDREFAAINACDASILVSDQELEVVKNELPAEKLHILPLILETPGTKEVFADRRDIVFVGGFQHTPNIDAVQYFVAEIMPFIRQGLPGVCFYVIGSKPSEEIKALASDDVIIAGFVEDLISMLDQMRLSVAPLRYGAGIKGKIGTAMGAGLPTVATTLAAEGMSLTNQENIIVADDPQEFANAIINLYSDENLWNNISLNGLSFAKKAWSAENSWKILSNIIKILGINVNSDKYPLSIYSAFDFSDLTINRNKLKQ